MPCYSNKIRMLSPSADENTMPHDMLIFGSNFYYGVEMSVW